jgi:hypothetical protein
MMARMVLLALALLVWASPAPAQTGQRLGSQASPSELLAAAEARFDLAVQRFKDEKVLTPALFREAAMAYDAILDGGVVNARLLLNAGNAWLLAGDTGRAVLAYRRAERLKPVDLTVQKSLAHARAQVGLALAPSAGYRLSSALMAWRGWIPRSWILTGALGAYALLWTMAAARFTPWSRLSRPGLAWVCAGAAGLCTLMLWADRRASSGSRDGVIVAPAGADARNGPSSGVYDPSFDQPLAPGVEVKVLEERLGWVRVLLIDGRETWVEARAIERV